jgi:flagellin-like hook-associated protein FlgL
MGGTVNSIKANVESFVNELDSTGQPWKVKIVSFSDITIGEAIEKSSWASDLASVNAALESTLTLKDGGDYEESLIDGLANAINLADWSSDSGVIKKIVSFTDATSKMPEPESGTIDSIAASAIAKGITIDIYGRPADPVTAEFAEKSGATLKTFEESSDMGSLLSDLADSFYTDTGINLELVAEYIAQNGASQSAIQNLSNSVKLNSINLKAATSRITDVDVGSESTRLARTQILLQAGTAMLAQANTSQQSLVRLLQG